MTPYKGTISQFLENHFLHFNAAALVDAAKAYNKQLEGKSKMLVSLAGAMSTAEIGKTFSEIIRQDKVHIVSCTGANLEEDIMNLVAHSHYKRVPNYRDLTPQDEWELLTKGLNRVTDTCIPEEEAFRRLQKHIFKIWKDADANKLTWDRAKLKIPLVGRVIESRFYVQFLETLANLVGNGLPLLRSLELARDATQNLHIRQHMNEVIEMVGDGRSFSRALIHSGIFPPLLIDMVSVGEKTGKIDKSLRRAAERYDTELNKSLARIMELIMPVVLVVMALLIGTMAYLMITAIFQTIQNLGGR